MKFELNEEEVLDVLTGLKTLTMDLENDAGYGKCIKKFEGFLKEIQNKEVRKR